MASFLAIGSVTIDRIAGQERLGGSALYASVMAQNLGYEPRILTSAPAAVCSRVADEWGIEARSAPAATATTFEHEYAGGARHSRCVAVAPALKPAFVAAGGVPGAPTVVCPNVHEIGADLAAHPAFAGALLLPQGWFRRVGADRRVTHGPALHAATGSFAWVVASADDLSGDARAWDWCKAAGARAVRTDGAGAMWVHADGTEERLDPPVRATDKDPTGAGDAFATTAYLAWRAGASLRDAVLLGSVAGSLKAAAEGVAGLPTRAALSRRAEAVGLAPPPSWKENA